MIKPNNDTDREITSTHRARVRVRCVAVRCSRVRRARLRASNRIAPATSSSRFELFGTSSMSMRANDRAEHRYRSRRQLYTSSSSPRSMRGGEVLARAPRAAARARDRVAPATSSSRSPQSGALPMGMCLNDKAKQRYRSRSHLYTSSSGPRSMRGGEVLTRAPRSRPHPHQVRHVPSKLWH